MATAAYTSFYYVYAGKLYKFSNLSNVRINDTPIEANKYRMTVDDSHTRPNSTADLYFYGYTSSGEPVFTIPGGYPAYIATNTSPPEGSPAPSYTPSSTFVACFLAGTLISTPQGERAVEDLVPGDLILAADRRDVPVKWIGRQSVSRLFQRDDERAPIRIAAGALGPNLPARDLKLTAEHALLLDGVLVQAGALVNGTTIRRMTRAETGDHYTVFHIETEGHEIILAEGCAAETFVDSVTRKRFDNYAEYEALFGDEVETILEMDLPRALSARQVPERIRALIAAPLAA